MMKIFKTDVRLRWLNALTIGVFLLALASGFHFLGKLWFWKNLYRQGAVAAATVAVPILLYAAAPQVVPFFWPNVPDFRPLPGRNNFVYVLSPWKHREAGARAFGEQILETLPPHSVLFADYSIMAVVRYLQEVEGKRPDIELMELAGMEDQASIILNHWREGKRALFLADTYRYYNVEEIGAYFSLVPDGPVFRLVPKPVVRGD